MKDFKFLEEDMNREEKEALNLFKTTSLLQLKIFRDTNLASLSLRELRILNRAINYHRDYISLKLSKNETKTSKRTIK